MRFGKILVSAAAAILISQAPAFAAQHRGVVVETITGGGYTYMNIEENGEKFWIAGPQNTVTKGAEVSFNEQVWMPNFASRALNRTFDKILFVSGVDDGTAGNEVKDGNGASIDEVHGYTAASGETPADEEVSSDEDLEEDAPEPPPADGIYSIERIYKDADYLKGQKIKVRGKVVKVSENIMGMTWVHIQDGTGTKGKNKLVFRSAKDTAKLGDTVVAEGTVDTDKDFGFGYYYAVIVEDAAFTE